MTTVPPALSDLLAPRCGCSDCESAVSPGAYLATLLDYALKHVQNGDAALDLAYLEDRLHQPLGRLPLDCESADTSVAQPRLAIEVLRRYVGPRPLLGAARETALVDGEAAYRLAAYTALLAGIGASYEEVRRVRSAPPQERLALAKRLGLPLTAPVAGAARHDELDELFLDAAVPVTDPAALTELALHRLFGLAQTTGDPLSSGVKSGDATGALVGWRFTGADPGRNTDPEGVVHLAVRQDGGVCVVSAYADAARTELVATGARPTPTGPVRLVPREGSGLVGALELAYTGDAADVSVQVASLVLCRRLARLRAGWLREDWPEPAPTVDPPDVPAPLVDPQTVGVGDLRRARPGDAAYDLWLARHNDLAARRTALEGARTAAADPAAAVAAVIGLGLTRPGAPVDVAQLAELDAAQRLGERIGPRLAVLGLTPAAFRFLMPIVAMAQAGEPVLDSEWAAVIDSALVAGKRRDFPAWREQERTAGITLSADHFRLRPDSEGTAPEQARNLTIAPWLSTREARRSWVDALQARVDQEAAVRAGVDGARNAAEEATLTLLRDTLVLVSDAEGDDLSARAEWLTRRLLLDLRMAGTHRSTRVAQAIETLQELLFRLRTGQLPRDDPGRLTARSSVRAVATGDGCTHLLARDDDGILWHRVWDGRWRSWRQRGPLPGPGPLPASDLAVTGRGGGFDVAVVGGDRVLWVRRFEAGWEPWQAVAGGPELSGGPGLTARTPTALDAFVLRSGDLQVLRRSWDGAAWSPAEDVGATSHRNPAAISLEPATVDLVLARSGADLFKPLHRWWDGAAWQSENLDGVLGGEPALLGFPPGRIEVFQNSGGHVGRLVRDGAWQAWEDVDAGLPPTDPQLVGAPAVCAPQPGAVVVYAVRVGRGGTALCTRRLTAGVWSSWEPVPGERLELDALQFDAEWHWVGSYATWRSAVFVRLYPDNLLLPSLAPRQSPAFAELVAQTRPTRRISPGQGLQLAGEYSRYLADVSHLKVQASCRATVTITGPSGLATSRALDFLFGLAPSGRVYWSSFDQLAVDGGYAQSFWTEVPIAAEGEHAPVKVTSVVGALPWVDQALDQHHLNLLVQLATPSGRTLARFRFDLERYGRDDFCEVGAVEVGGLPPGYGGTAEGVDRMTVVPVQSDSTAEAPRLAVHVWSSATAYIRAMNAGTDGFAPVTGDWAACEVVPRRMGSGGISGPESVTGLHAALRTGGRNWVLYSHGPSIRLYPVAPGAVATDVGEPPDRVLGTIAGSSSSVFVFTAQDGLTTYRRFTRSGATVTAGTIFLAPGVTGLARHCGSPAPSLLVTPGASGHSYAYLCRVEGDRLSGTDKYDVVPVLDPATSVLPKGTVFELQARRTALEGVYARNAAASESILSYLREAYRLVPQQIGLALQSGGEFVAALDWFATVYDYRAPQADRCIDHGLALDAALPVASVVRQPEGWLLDPLNPHAIARTRRAATARYAIATVIGCLNAYADAEFSVDTSESLVRARLLYDSALGLCDVPQLRQALPDCGALIGALEIQPGVPVPPEVAAALGAIREELTQGEAFPAPGTVFSMTKHVKLVELAKAGLVGWETVLPQLLDYKNALLGAAPPPATATQVLAGAAQMRATAQAALLADPAVERAVRRAGSLGAGAARPLELAEIAGAP